MQAQVVPGGIVIYINGLHVLGPAGFRYLDGYEGRTLMMETQALRVACCKPFPTRAEGAFELSGGF